MNKQILLFLTAFLLFEAPTARAVTCNWVTVPTNVNFGTYSVFSASPLTATSSLSVFCTPPGSATLTLSRGVSATFNPRTMIRLSNPFPTLAYNLYRDAANTIIWGDGTGGTQFLTLTPAAGGTTFSATIYGTIPAGVDAQIGTFIDLIQASLIAGSNTDQQNFTVNATVPAECTVSTATVNFAGYDPVTINAAAPKDSTGTVNVYCTIGTVATVSLDLGAHASGTSRRMLGSSGGFLTYELYRDAARTTIWNAANTNGGTSVSKNTAIGGGFTAYGRIFAGQDVGVASYSDTILVTVNY